MLYILKEIHAEISVLHILKFNLKFQCHIYTICCECMWDIIRAVFSIYIVKYQQRILNSEHTNKLCNILKKIMYLNKAKFMG